MAALKGSREIAFTVVSMSLSLIAVFIPILLMGGIVGRLFREFSVTLAFAIAVSLVVSLTTTPSMCAKFLHPISIAAWKAVSGIGTVFEWILGGYRVLSAGCCVIRLMLGVTVATACLSVYLYVIVPKGFFPQQDTGRLQGNIQASPDMAFAIVNQKLQQFVDIVRGPRRRSVGGAVVRTRPGTDQHRRRRRARACRSRCGRCPACLRSATAGARRRAGSRSPPGAGAAAARVLLEQLGVAEDAVQRRAQLVAQVEM